MEFNKSSLLGLKAELLRKQQEIANAKASSQGYVRPPPKVKIKTISDKVNEGVEKRDLLDKQEKEVPGDMLEKSQQMLLAKTRLYEELVSKKSSKDTSSFLVNFKAKGGNREKPNSEPEMGYSSSESDSDWVEFTDCLGRTRRCLKEDVEEMKKRDEIFERSSISSGRLPEKRAQPSKAEPSSESYDLLSGDMQRELLRQKWEKEEEELLGARDIHYQDVLFDEARQHGVGYYAFSTDETERKRQQQELRDLRKQTEEEKQTQAVAREKKKNQRRDRLRAARRRKRERLGLPPDEGSPQEESDEEPPPAPAAVVEDKNEQDENSKKVRKPTQVREWDLGKEGVSKVLSQGEWVKKKRDERVSEFAPPTSFGSSKKKYYIDKRGNSDADKSNRKKLKKELDSSDSEDYSDDDKESRDRASSDDNASEKPAKEN